MAEQTRDRQRAELHKAIWKIANDLCGSVDERNKRLKAILDGVGDMVLGDIRDNEIDAFGDAYEHLMTMYAAGDGKSGGEFFMPQEA